MGRIFLQSNDLCLERYLPGRYIQLTKDSPGLRCFLFCTPKKQGICIPIRKKPGSIYGLLRFLIPPGIRFYQWPSF